MESIRITPGRRKGTVAVPPSKSHLHRLLIADFLSGGHRFADAGGVSEDVNATCRCLSALYKASASGCSALLDCGESGSTLRFLLPLATTMVDSAEFIASGRLPNRPVKPFLDILSAHGVVSQSGISFPLRLHGRLRHGEFRVRGDISSQIVSGLLLALPLLGGDSSIVCITPLESRGYVDMTLGVMEDYGIVVSAVGDSFHIAGNQSYVATDEFAPELDWSGAAFWLAMNSLGSDIDVPGLSMRSSQPDRKIAELLAFKGEATDVSQCPDSFPVLAVVAAARPVETRFIGVKRLRLKESDRLASMAEVLSRLGVRTQIGEDFFIVHGVGPHFMGGASIDTYGDHRIAMAAAVAATIADAPVAIENPACAAKSYPDFFKQFASLENLDKDYIGCFPQ